MTANPHRGEASILLSSVDRPDGETYTLRPSMEAVVEVEEALGKNLVGVAAYVARLQPTTMEWARILRPFLKAGGTDLSEKQVAEMVVATGVMNITEPLSKVLEHALTGGREPKTEGNRKAAKAKA